MAVSISGPGMIAHAKVPDQQTLEGRPVTIFFFLCNLNSARLVNLFCITTDFVISQLLWSYIHACCQGRKGEWQSESVT